MTHYPQHTVSQAHDAFLARVMAAKPHVIRHGDADAVDLEEIAEHVTVVFAALAEYLGVIMQDADYCSSPQPFGASKRIDIVDAIREAFAWQTDNRRDIVGSLIRAADECREEAW